MPRSDDHHRSDPVLFVNTTPEYTYTLLIGNNTDKTTEAWASNNLTDWTKLHEDVTPNVSDAGGTKFADGLYINGTYYLYQTVEDDYTVVWSGSNLSSIQPQERIENQSDVGVIRWNETVYLYAEAYPIDGPTGNGLRLLTSPDGVSNWTDRGVVIDVREEDWHTGDPEIRRYNGSFYLWMDRSLSHPTYHVALAQSDNLLNWSITDGLVNEVYGGDAAVRGTVGGDGFVMFTEFTGDDLRGVGMSVNGMGCP